MIAAAGAPSSQGSVSETGTWPPAAATSASVAHLKVKGMATVTSLAASISSSEMITVRCRSGRSAGHT
jgi:hypothetical protein